MADQTAAATSSDDTDSNLNKMKFYCFIFGAVSIDIRDSFRRRQLARSPNATQPVQFRMGVQLLVVLWTDTPFMCIIIEFETRAALT